ncbi:MAG: bifunctional riboflavin kinase/FAD synthetase [Euryhalocaulis sp.]|nr:bifunctional riboflavin kinase/FAD synthetase [Euryhalocaulis sp.]
MQVHRGWTGLPDAARGCAVALGNFDGVHKGHRAVLAAAAKEGAPLAAAVFDPHPRRFFAPDSPPFRLSSNAMRAELLDAAGADHLFALPFDEDLRETAPEAFARDILSEGLGAVRVAVGEDFRFGKDRAGDVAALEAFGRQYGFEVAAVAPVEAGGGVASSTRVRDALKDGDVALATEILGHDWRIDGEVIGGDRLGRELGWPTANIEMGDYLRPLHGVYAVRCRIDGEEAWRPGVASLGLRPTVEGKDERFEVHLFDFSGDLYGKRVETAFAGFIRGQEKFDSVDALVAEMERDGEKARALLNA